MIKLKLLCENIRPVYITHRTYLTNEFKNVLDKHLDVATAAMPLKCFKQVANDVDLFTNRLPSKDINERNVCEQFAKLRSTIEGTNAFNLANHSIIKGFIDAKRFKELSDIFKNRLYYRIFPDHYIGCYLIDELLKLEQFSLATNISVQFSLQEDFENNLITALSAKTFFEYVKCLIQNPPIIKTAEEKEKEIREKKNRVKYLRNTSINEIEVNSYNQSSIGKSMIMLTGNLPDPVKNNIKILGYLIAEMNQDCDGLLLSDSKNFNADVLCLCETYLTDKPTELLKTFQLYKSKNKTFGNFKSELESVISQTCATSENTLIKDQINKYDKWAIECANDIKHDVEMQQRTSRILNISKNLEEFYERNKKLRFFELQDNIDMEIFEKKKIYPKRWFGKKKKPKVVDDSYIPPEVMKRAL